MRRLPVMLWDILAMLGYVSIASFANRLRYQLCSTLSLTHLTGMGVGAPPYKICVLIFHKPQTNSDCSYGTGRLTTILVLIKGKTP